MSTLQHWWVHCFEAVHDSCHCLTKQHTATCTRNKHIQTKTALTQKYLDLLLLNFLQLFTRLFTLKYKFIEMLLICINIARAKTEIQFLPCDSYAECRQCYARCLCVKCWCCIEMDKCTIKHCSPSDSHTIVVISDQTVWQYSDRDHTIGGIECSWSDFWPTSHFISKMIQDRTMVTMECE